MNEDIKQRIIEFNNRFGIRTKFIKDESILGYALGRTIYINENIDQDYEKTNRHELLHFFENTPEFEEIKRRLLEEHKEELEEIRGEYELRYFGIYSDEEIASGVLDNEIVIDMMINNLSFEYEEGLRVGEEFLGEIEKGLEEKRYLNLSLTANIRNLNLSEWEKIFVLNYYDGKERKLPQERGEEKLQKIKEDIEAYLQELYELKETEMQIDPTSEEVIREYESEIKALKARGEDTSYIERTKEARCKEIAEKTSNELYAEYKHIVDLMKGLDIEPAFKSMMLRETLTKIYKLDIDKESKDTKTIVKNRKLHGSIAGHMILNETTLKFIYENINTEEYKNFANIYFAAVEIYKKTISKKSEIELEGVDTYGKGKWLKFDGKGRDEKNYLENAKKLAALVQDTPWCTKQLASSQLANGDFYVFVDNEGKPHIAVRMEGNEIAEVRGIENGNAQELEEEYREVAISFLENNKDIKNGKQWLEKEEWNKRLIEYKRKIDNGEITLEDIPKIIEDYLRKDFGSHGGYDNSNRTALKVALEKNKGLIAKYYKCEEDEICIGDANFKGLTKNPYKIILGNAYFSYSQVTDLGNLQSIGGNAYFSYSQITNLGNLQSVGGNAYFSYSQITNLGNLQSIGGDAYFRDSKITSLGNLQSIEGNADFRDSKITSSGKLERIGGNADFKNSKITNLENLQTINGNADFEETKIENLGRLESIGGYANFRNSQITDLGNLKRIEGDAYFYNSKIKNLGSLERIGGNANFNNAKIENLGNLQSIGAEAYFRDSQITNLGNLQSIGRNADFRKSQIKNLESLERIEGNADFSDSKITSLGNLESIGGNVDFRDSQITSLGNLKSIGRYADFRDSRVTDLGSLQSIGGSADFRNSQITSLGNLQSIGGSASFENSKVTDLGNLQKIEGSVSFENSQITDLGNLKSIGGYAYFYNSQIENLGSLEKIGGYATFANSKITNLGNLQYVGGDAYFRDSKITSLGNLESIGGNADFRNSQVTDLGKLQSIGGNADFRDSKITSSGKLQSIGGNADFKNSKITDLENLQTIGGNADFEETKIKNLGRLESIGGNASFEFSEIMDLGNLKSIGEDAYFYSSKIKNLGSLESIGGSAYFRCSQITDLGSLRNIGGDAEFYNSKIKNLGSLRNIGGKAEFGNSIMLKTQYELSKKRNLTGQDIGKAGFGVSTKICDAVQIFIRSAIELLRKNKGRGDN